MRSNQIYLLVFLVVLGAFVPAILLRDFNLLNELNYLGIAQDALERGAYFTFYHNGAPYADKPPLYLWLCMIGLKLFGSKAMAWLLLCSVLSWLFTMVLMDHNFGSVFRHQERLLLILGMSSLLFVDVCALVGRMDMLFTAAMLWAYCKIIKRYSLIRTQDKITGRCKATSATTTTTTTSSTTSTTSASSSSSISTTPTTTISSTAYAVKYGNLSIPLCLFLGIFIKGPYALLMPLVALIMVLAYNHDLKRFFRVFRPYYFLFILLCCALWAGAVYVEGGRAYLENLFITQSAARLAGNLGHPEPFYYYLSYYPVLTLPLGLSTLFFIGYQLTVAWHLRHPQTKTLADANTATAASVKTTKTAEAQPQVLTLGLQATLFFVLAVLVVVSIPSSKLEMYFLPAVPPLFYYVVLSYRQWHAHRRQIDLSLENDFLQVPASLWYHEQEQTELSAHAHTHTHTHAHTLAPAAHTAPDAATMSPAATTTNTVTASAAAIAPAAPATSAESAGESSQTQTVQTNLASQSNTAAAQNSATPHRVQAVGAGSSFHLAADSYSLPEVTAADIAAMDSTRHAEQEAVTAQGAVATPKSEVLQRIAPQEVNKETKEHSAAAINLNDKYVEALQEDNSTEQGWRASRRKAKRTSRLGLHWGLEIVESGKLLAGLNMRSDRVRLPLLLTLSLLLPLVAYVALLGAYFVFYGKVPLLQDPLMGVAFGVLAFFSLMALIFLLSRLFLFAVALTGVATLGFVFCLGLAMPYLNAYIGMEQMVAPVSRAIDAGASPVVCTYRYRNAYALTVYDRRLVVRDGREHLEQCVLARDSVMLSRKGIRDLPELAQRLRSLGAITVGDSLLLVAARSHDSSLSTDASLVGSKVQPVATARSVTAAATAALEQEQEGLALSLGSAVKSEVGADASAETNERASDAARAPRQ